MPLIEINTIPLHYRLMGPKAGTVVMLSHSLGANLEMWRMQVPDLVAAGFRVLTYDTRGHGASGAPAGDYALETLVHDLVGLLDHLELEKVHFCGLSMGGMVGQMAGAQFGHRLFSLVLSSTAAHLPPRQLWDERMAAVREGGMSVVVDATIDRWFTPAGQVALPEDVKQVREVIAGTPVNGFCGCSAALRDMDLRETIRAIETPTLVVVGEEDPGTPVSAAQFIHDRIAGSRLEIISDAAHYVQMQQATDFNRILLGFLKDHA